MSAQAADPKPAPRPADFLADAGSLTLTPTCSPVDGQEVHGTDAAFQQLYEVLRLPDYFGWNWDALSDCLRDQSGCPRTAVLIVEAANEAQPSVGDRGGGVVVQLDRPAGQSRVRREIAVPARHVRSEASTGSSDRRHSSMPSSRRIARRPRSVSSRTFVGQTNHRCLPPAGYGDARR